VVGPQADLFSGLYALLAVYTLVKLWTGWRSLRDDRFTRDDQRLAELIGLTLLTPPAVLIHELAHLAVARALGNGEAALHFRLYWGYVSLGGPAGPTEGFLVAAAGPLSTTVLGLAALLVAARRGPVWGAILRTFGQVSLSLILVGYPIWSLTTLSGDFVYIYLLSLANPILPVAAAAVHLLALAAFARLSRRGGREPVWAEAGPVPDARSSAPPPSAPASARDASTDAPAAATDAPEAATDAPEAATDAPEAAVGSGRPAPVAPSRASTLLGWTAATALAVPIGLAIGPLGAFPLLAVVELATAALASSAPPRGWLVVLALAGGGAALGGAIGWAQYLTLRRWTGQPEGWIGRSILAGAVAGLLAGLVGDLLGWRGRLGTLPAAPTLLAFGAIGGLLQWRWLRRRVGEAGWWVLASLGGYGGAAALIAPLTAGAATPADALAAQLAGGALAGAVTAGAALLPIERQIARARPSPRPAEGG
jgi:hypothetical protein